MVRRRFRNGTATTVNAPMAASILTSPVNFWLSLEFCYFVKLYTNIPCKGLSFVLVWYRHTLVDLPCFFQ